MNRVLVALAAGAVLASAPVLACDDMKSGGYDGGVIASQAPAAPVATPQKVAEPPLVVKQKQVPGQEVHHRGQAAAARRGDSGPAASDGIGVRQKRPAACGPFVFRAGRTRIARPGASTRMRAATIVW